MSIVEAVTQKGSLVGSFLLEMLKLDVSEELYKIVKHQVVAGGKRLRPAMTILCCEAVGGSVKDAIPAAAAVELVHNYTLIFDDIIDRSDLRRNLPTVRAEYGDVMALLAGMHYREAIFEAAKRSSKSKEIDEILSATLKKIIEGERLDVLFEQGGRESEYLRRMLYTSVSEKEYFGMVEAKTAVLFEAACKVGGLVGSGTRSHVDALSRFGWNCGMAFQIVDDILDVVGETSRLGKEAGKDIKEHKLGNVVVLYSLEELSESQKNNLRQTLKLQNISDSKVKAMLEIVLSTKAVEKARVRSKDYVDRAKSSLGILPASKARNMLLDLADFLIQRSF